MIEFNVTSDEQIHQNMVNNGFYAMSTSVLEKVSKILTEDELLFVKKAIQDQRLLLIVSELTEALEAGRKNRYCQLNNDELLGLLNEPDAPVFKTTFEQKVKDTFENELADARIRLADYSGYINQNTGISIPLLVELTTRYNKMREYLHGKTH